MEMIPYVIGFGGTCLVMVMAVLFAVLLLVRGIKWAWRGIWA